MYIFSIYFTKANTGTMDSSVYVLRTSFDCLPITEVHSSQVTNYNAQGDKPSNTVSTIHPSFVPHPIHSRLECCQRFLELTHSLIYNY